MKLIYTLIIAAVFIVIAVVALKMLRSNSQSLADTDVNYDTTTIVITDTGDHPESPVKITLDAPNTWTWTLKKGGLGREVSDNGTYYEIPGEEYSFFILTKDGVETHPVVSIISIAEVDINDELIAAEYVTFLGAYNERAYYARDSKLSQKTFDQVSVMLSSVKFE